MTELEKQARTAENLINTIFRLSEEGKLKETDYLDIVDCLERIKKMSEKVIKTFESPLKETLEFNNKVEVGNRIYFYKSTDSRVFNAQMAKNLLKTLDYNLDDFHKLQTKRQLVWEVKK